MAAEQRKEGPVSGSGEPICVATRDCGCNETCRLFFLTQQMGRGDLTVESGIPLALLKAFLMVLYEKRWPQEYVRWY